MSSTLSTTLQSRSSTMRARWAAIGAAVAISCGAGGIGIVRAAQSPDLTPSAYIPIEPCRLADTRPGPSATGNRQTPLQSGETFTFDGWGTVGACELASGTSALSLNVTAVGATLPTFLQFFPADVAKPSLGSSLNPVPGQPPTPNAVNVTIDDAGRFNVFNLQGTVDVVIDVVGLYDDEAIGGKGVVAFEQGNSNTPLASADVVVKSVQIAVPAAGTVIATYGGYIDSPNNFRARCSLTTTTSIDVAAEQTVAAPVVDSSRAQAMIAGTRGFALGAATSLTVNLVCDSSLGNPEVRDVALNATFTPG